MRNLLLGTVLALGPAVLVVGLAAPVHGAPEPPKPTIPTPPHGADPLTQCPAIGADTGCALLLVINPDGTVTVQTDASQGPYDGVEDTLIGVQNNATFPVTHLSLLGVTSPVPTFGFDGDGLCTRTTPPGNPQPGCPFGSTGYEGPNTSFSSISTNMADGVVNFTHGLAPGASAFFSLEGIVSAQNVVVPPLTPPLTPPLVSAATAVAPAAVVVAPRFTG